MIPRRVLQEFLATEKSYVADLSVVVNVRHCSAHLSDT